MLLTVRRRKWTVPSYLELGAWRGWHVRGLRWGVTVPSSMRHGAGPRYVLIRIVVPGHSLDANVTSRCELRMKHASHYPALPASKQLRLHSLGWFLCLVRLIELHLC